VKLQETPQLDDARAREGIRMDETHSQDWWMSEQWTDQHYASARKLMKKIHVLSPDWNEDIIQRVAVKYPNRFKTWDRKNFEGWFYKLLLNEARDVRKNELGRKPAERTYLSLETVQHRLTNAAAEEHSKEWKDLVRRAMKRDPSLSEDDLKMVAAHCLECPECDALYRHQTTEIGVSIDPVSTTVRVVIGDCVWNQSAPTTRELFLRIIALTDQVVRQQQDTRSRLVLQYYLVRKRLELLGKQLKKKNDQNATNDSKAV
jgi:hypothetical protein